MVDTPFSLTVEVRTATNSLATTQVPVNLEITTNPTGGLLGGVTTVTSVNGIASFTDLTIDQAGPQYTLRAFSTANPPSPTTTSLDVWWSGWRPANGQIFGLLRAFAADPLVPGRMFAGGTRGIFVSHDSGAHWSPGVVQTGVGLDVTWLVADPLNAGTVYVGTKGRGVWMTQDGGALWYPTGNGSFPIETQDIQALAVQGTSPSYIYAATSSGVYRSKFSEWWLWSTPTLTEDSQALVVEDTGVVHAGTISGRVMRSQDNGGTWTQLCDMPGAVTGLANRTGTGIVYASGNGTYRATGCSLLHDANTPVTALASLNTNLLISAGSRLFSGTSSIAERTHPFSVPFQAISLVPPVGSQTAYLTQPPSGVLSTTNYTAYTQITHGITDGESAGALPISIVLPMASSRLLVSSSNGTFLSDDGAFFWNAPQPVSGQSPCPGPLGLATKNPVNGDWYASTGAYLCLSTAANNGSAWTLQYAAGSTFRAMAISQSPRMYVVMGSSTLSTTNLPPTGFPTTEATPFVPTHLVATFVSPNSRIYAGGPTGVAFRASSSTWTMQPSGLGSGAIQALMVDPQNSALLLASVADTIYQGAIAGDGTVTWTTDNAAAPATVRTLAANQGVQYAATAAGVYQHVGGGWTRITGSPNNVRSVAVQPGTPTLIMAGTDDNGLFIFRP